VSNYPERRQLTVHSEPLPGGPLLWIGPFFILAAAATMLYVNWGELPDRVVVHWGSADRIGGRPSHGDRFSWCCSLARGCRSCSWQQRWRLRAVPAPRPEQAAAREFTAA
jgi:hypothetical protein